MRLHFLDTDPERRRRLARTATGTLFVVTTLTAIAVAIAADPVSRALLGESHPDEIRAAALGLWAFTNLELAYALLRVEERGRAFATASLINVALTVAADRLPRRPQGRGRARPAARQLRRLRGRPDRPVDRRARGVRVPARRDRAGAARPDAALRAAHGPRGGLGLRALLHRPPLAVPPRGRRRRGRLLALGQARGRRRLHGPRLPVRLAAARLLDRVRRGGEPRLRADHDLLRALHRRRRRGPRAARALAGQAVRRRQVLRRPRGAAVGGAGLGAVRALPRPGGDGGPGAGDDPQRARRALRAGGQRRPARPARRRRSGSRARASRSPAPTS